MYKSVILPLAVQDIREAAWYDRKRQGLGKEFLFEVRKAEKYIKKNPEAIAIRYDDTRTILLKRFPFLVHFTVDRSEKIVLVTAVLHTSRSPEKWRR